jgi:hypothetical protein
MYLGGHDARRTHAPSACPCHAKDHSIVVLLVVSIFGPDLPLSHMYETLASPCMVLPRLRSFLSWRGCEFPTK